MSSYWHSNEKNCEMLKALLSSSQQEKKQRTKCQHKNQILIKKKIFYKNKNKIQTVQKVIKNKLFTH